MAEIKKAEVNAAGRPQWATNFGFIMAAAGSAIGLGNLWKFPYLAGKYGGGAFVVIYLLIVLFVGFTIMLGEMVIGRTTQLSSVNAYNKLNKKWTFLGVMGVLSGFMILSFYSVIGGWVLNYIAKYVTGGVSGDTAAYFGSYTASVVAPIFWHCIFMGATAVIVFKGIGGGIEKACKFMMPALFLILIIIGIRSVTLPGAGAGVEYYLKPDFSKLTPEAIVAACGQVFFSLSLGMGCMVTYGSYLGKGENLEKNAIIVPFLDTLAALLAGFAIIPAVFAFGLKPDAGPSLMFITLPQVFQQMPMGNLFGLLFFILVLFAALTSSISLLEVTVSFMVDQYKWVRSKATVALSTIIFVVGIPCALSFGPMANFKIMGKTVFDLMDYITNNITLPLGGLLMCIFIGYVWGIDNAVKEVIQGGKFSFKLLKFWKISIKYIAPLALIVVFLNVMGFIKF